MKIPSNIEKYGRYFNASGMWDKIRKVAAKAGLKVIYYVIVLYYALDSGSLSPNDKRLVLGALGYFLLPVDLLPDAVPFLGFADDYAALALVIYKVINSITPDVKARAEAKLHDLFGSFDSEEVSLDNVDWGNENS